MKITADLFILLCYVLAVRSVISKQMLPKNMNEKNVNNFTSKKNVSRRLGQGGISNLNLISFDRSAFPAPLPTDPPKEMDVSPYRTLYQGVRYQDDVRVFRKRFDHEATLTGQKVVCQGLFDCIISHISIESTEAIPVLLRGGAGYRHFTAVIRAKPHHDLKGQVRAYCRNKYAPPDDADDKIAAVSQRRFYFGDLENEDVST